MTDMDYWAECIGDAADGCGLRLTEEQLKHLAKAVSDAHESYGMAFYSPPASDRVSQIERENELKLRQLEAEFASYRENAETAVKQALGQYRDARVSIGEYGEVLRHGGRTERIQ